jgi:flagellar assembly protein FliH
MHLFKRNPVEVIEEGALPGAGVTEYDAPVLKRSAGGGETYREMRYGSRPAAGASAQRDSRFAINPLLRAPLSIEQEEAQLIQSKVDARVQELRAEVTAKAQAEGYDAGLVKGSDEARAQTRTEAVELINRFESLFRDLDSAKDKIFKVHERFVIAMVYEIAQAVVLRELKTDREYVSRLAKTVIEQIGVRENIRVKIHPSEIATLDLLKADLYQSLTQLKNLTVETSEEVRLGGCIVETELNVVNATIENQLESYKAALLGTPAVDPVTPEKAS